MAASGPVFNTATNVANGCGISDPHSIAQTPASKQPFAQMRFAGIYRVCASPDKAAMK
jgi:hypothetical protein